MFNSCLITRYFRDLRGNNSAEVYDNLQCPNIESALDYIRETAHLFPEFIYVLRTGKFLKGL
jgi:hypothetical protein